MAARENQGYLIAVIILVLLTLVLALIAFMGISRAAEYYDGQESAKSQALLNDKLARANETRAQILEAMIGDRGVSAAEIQTLADTLDKVRQDPNLDDNQKGQVDTVIQKVRELRTKFEEDMKQDVSAENAEESQELTYTSLITSMASVLNDKHSEVNILRNDINRIRAETDKTIQEKDAEIKAISDRLAVKQTEFDTEIQRANQKIAQLNATLSEVESLNAATQKKAQDARREYTNQVQNLNSQIVSTKEQNEILKEKVDRYEKETFDLPDGNIVRAASEYVYIDLGSADGLRTNRTFSVYDQSVTSFEKGMQKAAVEVVQILGPHQAEARILESSISDPIVRGDYVLTPTWDPGYSVKIGLVGMFDLDRDGRSDLQRLIRMIESNGGKVVAYHDEDGKVVGKVDSATRYLVLGDSPQPGETPDGVLNAVDTLLSQSKKNSVQEIDLKKLLDWMGVRGRAQVERLDSEMGSQYRRRKPIDRLQGNEGNRR